MPWQLIAIAAAPVLAVPFGTGVGLWREPRPSVKNAVQHLAAGLLIGAIAVELLAPVAEGSPLAAVYGVGAGLAAMLVLDVVSRSSEAASRSPAAWGWPRSSPSIC